MKNNNVMRATIALNLSKNIVGVKFLDFEKDYDMLNLPSPKAKGPLCYHVRQAMDGEHFRLKADDVSCDYARYALGLSKPDNTIVQGRSYEYCGLYESKSIAKEITSSMKYIEQKIYGVEIGPLKSMDKADIVIIADYAETIMRIMQGYAYKYGSPKNLCFYGNQAMCSDMVAKPFSNNDINISLMCVGTRKSGRFNKGELSVAFPISMFDNIVEGIVMTVNPVLYASDKNRILDSLENPNDLDIEINTKYNYGMGLREYDGMVQDIRNEVTENNH